LEIDMKIKMLSSMYGPDISRDPGGVYDVETKEAMRLIEGGHAVPVAEPKVERAVKTPPPETRKG
jgi:hypothetical protein